jgi:hypothetical protein
MDAFMEKCVKEDSFLGRPSEKFVFSSGIADDR